MRPADEAFGQGLAERGALSAAWLERLRTLSVETSESVPALLVKLGALAEQRVAEELCRHLNAQPATTNELSNSAWIPESVNDEFLRAQGAVPFRDADDKLCVALANGLDRYPLESLEFALAESGELRIATRTAIEGALNHLSGVETAPSETDREGKIEALRDLTSDAPVIRAVQRIIGLAYDQRASDIHFEPVETGLKVRIRVDGVLQDLEMLEPAFSEALVSRIKVMAQLNIAERRLPQDGRIRVSVHGRETDFRVATSPTHHGEAVVLRILDRRDVKLELDSLGFGEADVQRIRRAISQPHGIVLVTGPTGSGKTTTLYSVLRELNSPTRKILTIEDPIEYTLEGVNQVQVKPQIGLTFAHALRSFLRQDPDVMMVGEIRDGETAQIAIQAALTGHLVLSTVHTNSAAGAVTRLLDMGVEPYLMASTLSAVIGQRLVRKLCEHCRQPLDGATARSLGVDRALDEKGTYCKSVGCVSCAGTGYRKRTCVAEVLEVTDRVRKGILGRSDEQGIERVAVEESMQTLLMQAMGKAAAGVTSLEEALRVVKEA